MLMRRVILALLGILLLALTGYGAVREAGRGGGLIGVALAGELKSVKSEVSLHQAIEANDYRLLRRLLRSGADVNGRDAKGDTPLHLAVKRNYVEAVAILLAAGADTAATNREGLTPLEVARLAGNTSAAKILENMDSIWHSLLYVRLRELGLGLGLLLALLVHGLTWWLKQKKMLLAARMGAVIGGISYALAFLFLVSPYMGEIHSGLFAALLISLGAAAVLGYVHAAALQEHFLHTFLAVYVEMGIGFFGGILVVQAVERQVGSLYPWEGDLIYMFKSSLNPALLGGLLAFSLARGVWVLALRKRKAAG